MSYQDYLLESTPKLNISKAKIVIDTTYEDTGNIKIENIAGGFLHGKITKSDDFIELSAYEIDKNLVELNIFVHREKLKSGKTYRSSLYLNTNGGDKEIIVEIICEKNSYKVDSVTKFYGAKDIYLYSIKNMDSLVEFFNEEKFSSWINTLSIEIIEKYKFVSDVKNVYKQIDDFFILLGFKSNTFVKIKDFDNVIEIKPFQKEKIVKTFVVYKSDNGYCDCSISTKEKYGFLKFDKKIIGSNDFVNNEMNLNIEIDVLKLQKSHQRIIFYINNEKYELLLKKITDIVVSADKTIYKENDIGYITVMNSLDIPLKFEVTTNNKNIVIIDSVGTVDNEVKLAFKVNFTMFNKNIVKFFKQPYFDGEINIAFKSKDFSAKRSISLTLATENLEIK